MNNPGSGGRLEPATWLWLAGGGSIAAALLHLACMFGGPGWYRWIGAGDDIARAVERGQIRPYLLTIGIAAILFGWAWFAFAAARLMPRPPLLRTGLVAIILVLLLRAAALFVPELWAPETGATFKIVSSLIVLALGLSFLLGTIRAWPILSVRT